MVDSLIQRHIGEERFSVIRYQNIIFIKGKVVNFISKIKGSVNCVLVYEKKFQFFLKPLCELIIVSPGTVADKRGLIVDAAL